MFFSINTVLIKLQVLWRSTALTPAFQGCEQRDAKREGSKIQVSLGFSKTLCQKAREEEEKEKKEGGSEREFF